MIFSAEHPWPILLIIAIITLVGAFHIGNLKINISAQSMMIKGDPAWSFYQETEQTFGSDSIIIVFLSDPKLFAPAKLAVIRDVVQSIEALPFVTRTSSLYSARNIKNSDGLITTQPFLQEIPSDPKALERVKTEALHNPLVQRNLLSPDARSMAINIHTRPTANYPGFDKEATVAIEQAIAPLRNTLQLVFQFGTPSVRNALSDRILQDQRLVVPLSMVILVITLALSLRRANGAAIPLLTASLSVVWTLGLMAAWEIPINVITSIIPSLLIIIGSTEDIHLLAEYQAGLSDGKPREKAILHMAATMGTAVLLTFVTTYLGFLSITLNNIDLLQQFGLIASTGILLNFLITITVLPIYLRFFGARSTKIPLTAGRITYPHIAVAVYRTVSKNKYLTLGLIITGVLVSAYGALSLRVNNNPMDYFDRSSSITAQANTLHTKLSGMHTFSIVVDSGIDGTFRQVKYLNEIQKLQAYLTKMDTFDRSFSFADIVSLVHAVMEGEDQDTPSLPPSDDIVQEYMLFLKHRDVREYVSPVYDKARIIVRHNIGSSFELNQAVAKIRTLTESLLDPALHVEITGESIMTNRATDSMALGQAKSLILMVVTIFLIVSLLYVTPKAGLIAVVPNLVPIVVLFGVMGYTGIPLDSGTSMVAAIALGICVDDTMHFMARYHHQLQVHKDESTALLHTVRAEATPIIATSLALALGFVTLATSSFLPVVHFGLLSAMVIVLALLATFLLTPLLLSTTQLVTAWDVLSVNLGRDCISRCELFRGVPYWQIKKVLLAIAVQEYERDEIIIEQGELGRDVYVILEGSVHIRKKRADGSMSHLNTLSTGDVFGEIALIAQCPRTAEVVAAQYTRVLGLRWENIDRLSRIFPHVSMKLFRNLSSIVSNRLVQAGNESITLRDDLTGAYTRAYLNEQIKVEIAKARRHREPLSLLVLDIHAGGAPNENAASTAPNQNVRNVTDTMARTVRTADIFARWSHDVFMLLLPRTRYEDAQNIAQRVKTAAEAGFASKAHNTRVFAGVTHWIERDCLDSFVSRGQQALSMDKEENLGKRISERQN
jgi:diguanylate cyclase (GGDEF)-like protein